VRLAIDQTLMFRFDAEEMLRLIEAHHIYARPGHPHLPHAAPLAS